MAVDGLAPHPFVKIPSVSIVNEADMVIWHRSNDRHLDFDQVSTESAALIRAIRVLFRLGIRQHTLRDASNDRRAQELLESIVENNFSIEWPLVTFRGVMIGAVPQLESLVALQHAAPPPEAPLDLSQLISRPPEPLEAITASDDWVVLYPTSSQAAQDILQSEADHPREGLGWVSSFLWYTKGLFWSTSTATTTGSAAEGSCSRDGACSGGCYDLLQWNWYGRTLPRRYTVRDGFLDRFLPDGATLRGHRNLAEIERVEVDCEGKVTVSFVDQTAEYINGHTLPLLEDIFAACNGNVSIAWKETDPLAPVAHPFELIHEKAQLLISFVRQRLLCEEGIFRVNGVSRTAQSLVVLALLGSQLPSPLLALVDPYTLCDALKQLMKAHSSQPIVSHELYLDIRMFTTDLPALDIAVNHRLGPLQRAFLHDIFRFMNDVIAHERSNNLNPEALSRLLSPSIFSPPQKLSPSETLEYLRTAHMLFSRLYSQFLSQDGPSETSKKKV